MILFNSQPIVLKSGYIIVTIVEKMEKQRLR